MMQEPEAPASNATSPIPEDPIARAWTWSFSKWSRFKKCNESYRLRYVERRLKAPLSERPFLQGRIGHKLMENTHKRIRAGTAATFHDGLSDVDALFDNMASRIPWTSDREMVAARLEARELGARYAALLQEQDLHEGDVLCEYWFGTNDAPMVIPSGIRMVGSIDWVKFGPDRRSALIWDGKSNRGMEYLDTDQLRFYALAMRESFGVTIEKAAYLMMRWERPLSYVITPEEVADLEARMTQASRDIVAGKLGATTEMRQCGQCEYSDSDCGPYQHWILNGGPDREVDW